MRNSLRPEDSSCYDFSDQTAEDLARATSHDLYRQLASASVTPFDRESGYGLASGLSGDHDALTVRRTGAQPRADHRGQGAVRQ